MQLLDDITSFVSTLTFIDFAFFFAVIVLLVLIVTLMYFIKVNEEVLKNSREPVKPKSELELINDAIKKDAEREAVRFTTFEEEQEEKAIISYDELVKKSKNYDLNYIEEKKIDDLVVKQVNLDDMLSKKESKQPIIEPIRVISYKKEEEFLKALKNLQSILS